MDVNAQLSTLPLLDDIVWTKATSVNGKSYEVGATKAAAEVRSKALASGIKPIVFAQGKKEEFSIGVNWPVGDSIWKTTSSEVQDVAAVDKYKLYEYDGLYKYVLHFENTLHYDYKFKDESGDIYECDTWVNGDHYIRFDSDQPNIIRVIGN